MKIKICGLFRCEDIEYANEALPDYAGFVFAESRRQVSCEKAAELRKRLDRRISAVGVFVNNDVDFIADLVHNNIIDIVQLHGAENEDFVRRLHKKIPPESTVIKAFSVNSREDIERAAEFPSDFMLLDNGRGGTGQAFAWELLHENMPERVFLAGGVNTENIAQAAKLRPYCIDVSSGAETDGFKDREKILKLVQTAHEFNIK